MLPSMDIKLAQQEDHLTASMQLAYIKQGICKLFSKESDEDYYATRELVWTGLYPLEKPGTYSVLLMCPASLEVERFFYEMVVRWLVPGRKIALTSFFYTNFSSASLDEKGAFAFCEARFSCPGEIEEEGMVELFARIRHELVQGTSSPYQGSRILELKSLLSSDKTTHLYEKLFRLTRRRPEFFEGDLFSLMQHFLLSWPREFLQNRETIHLARIVALFYLFQKSLLDSIEADPLRRHVCFKVNRVRLYSPFGLRQVLGIFVGVQFFSPHELFEEKHLMQALQELLPGSLIVEGSLFIYRKKEEQLQLIYVEIEQQSGGSFSTEEISLLRAGFSRKLETQVEKLMPALFMPRNEEEVLKNILILGRQLHYVRDLPQGYISFEEQTDRELSFTVILLRILRSPTERPVREMFQKTSPGISFFEDRIKVVGMLRGKYEKEATVFRIKLSKGGYLRKDHSVDLLRARQDVVLEIQKRVGEFRDYNGGMISHQMQNLYALRRLLPQTVGDGVELENFFHRVFPVEMRSVISPLLLKAFYELWEERKEGIVWIRKERGAFLYLAHSKDPLASKQLTEKVSSLHLSSAQVLYFSCKERGGGYWGHLLQALSAEQEEVLSHKLREIEGSVIYWPETYSGEVGL